MKFLWIMRIDCSCSHCSYSHYLGEDAVTIKLSLWYIQIEWGAKIVVIRFSDDIPNINIRKLFQKTIFSKADIIPEGSNRTLLLLKTTSIPMFLIQVQLLPFTFKKMYHKDLLQTSSEIEIYWIQTRNIPKVFTRMLTVTSRTLYPRLSFLEFLNRTMWIYAKIWKHSHQNFIWQHWNN